MGGSIHKNRLLKDCKVSLIRLALTLITSLLDGLPPMVMSMKALWVTSGSCHPAAILSATIFSMISLSATARPTPTTSGITVAAPPRKACRESGEDDGAGWARSTPGQDACGGSNRHDEQHNVGSLGLKLGWRSSGVITNCFHVQEITGKLVAFGGLGRMLAFPAERRGFRES